MPRITTWTPYWARYGSDRTALIHGSRHVTWGELDSRAASLAGGLLAAGVTKGDRVGVLLRNVPEYFFLEFACARVGAVFVPLNPMLGPQEVLDTCVDAGLSLLFTDGSHVDRLGPVVDWLGERHAYFLDGGDGQRSFTELLDHPPAPADPSVTSEDPLFICYSSGTTGRPKGAVLTHGNIEAVADALISVDQLTASDRTVLNVPLSFTGSAIAIGMPALRAGGSIVLHENLDTDRLLHDMASLRVTYFGSVPVVFERLAQDPRFDQLDLDHWRYSKVGGAVVPQSLLERYRDRGIRLLAAYGLTENCAQGLSLPHHEYERKFGSVGLPIMGLEAKLLDAEGLEGARGELLLRGPSVMKEYWNQPELTRETLADGWLRTGDVAEHDEEGYFRIVDRIKDLIISGGVNVHPAEVEAVLSAHPDVDEVAVVGLPDDTWGEKPVAIVRSQRRDLALQDINTFANGSLAKFKLPKDLIVREEAFPRSMSGKILKRELRAELLAGQE